MNLMDRGGCGEAAAYKERTHYTPITVYWEIRQALMGDHVPMENPPFTAKTKELWQRNYTEARR